MADQLGANEFAAMFRCAAEKIRANHEELGRLDSMGGDGDHGATMRRAMDRAEEALAAAEEKDLAAVLKDVGWAIMGVDGGATGPLLGSLFTSMSKATPAEPVNDAHTLAAVFEAGMAGVQRRTKAQPGDKTMLDALVPAVQAMLEAAHSGASMAEALRAAAEAANEGAKATREMQARFGRAKNLGEKSVGGQDPGATSIAYIFAGFAQGVDSNA